MASSTRAARLSVRDPTWRMTVCRCTPSRPQAQR
jgi:hypothetical protein